ncbi:MAG: chalcone isomerase family protein [Sphingobacteriaceae bacterium]|nr:chalcone isomerase family protein [Sphingobacteriaceae bacterium]
MIRRIKSLVLFHLLIMNLSLRSQIVVGDVKVPTVFQIEETTLILNGAGLREKYFVDLYVLALYLKVKSSDALKIMHANEHMALKFSVVTNLLTSERMKEAVDEGFTRSTNGNTAPIQNKIDQFKNAFSEELKKGDVFDFVYDSSNGTHIIKNNKLITTIQGLDFKKALFGMWLYKKASDLQDKILGK